MYGWFIWPIVLGHWILMAIWLWLQQTAACSTRIEEFFFCLILAIIHIFTFFNVKPDRTRFRYAFYYTVSRQFIQHYQRRYLYIFLTGLFLGEHYPNGALVDCSF
jgi:hypothetical protein